MNPPHSTQKYNEFSEHLNRNYTQRATFHHQNYNNDGSSRVQEHGTDSISRPSFAPPQLNVAKTKYATMMSRSNLDFQSLELSATPRKKSRFDQPAHPASEAIRQQIERQKQKLTPLFDPTANVNIMEKYNELLEKYTNLTAESKQQQNLYNKVVTDYNDERKKYEELQSDLRSYRKSKAASDNSVKNLQKQNDELLEKFKETKDKLRSADKKNVSLKQEIKKLSSNKEQGSSRSDVLLEEVKKVNSELEVKIEGKENEIKELTKQVEDLKKKSQTGAGNSKDQSQLNAELEKLRKSSDEEKTKCDNALTELQKKEEEKKELEKLHKESESAKNGLKTDLENAKNDLKAKDTEIDDLKKQLKNNNSSTPTQTSDDQKKKYEEEIDALKKKIGDKETVIQNGIKKNSDLLLEKEKLDKEKERLDKENNELKDSLKNTSSSSTETPGETIPVVKAHWDMTLNGVKNLTAQAQNHVALIKKLEEEKEAQAKKIEELNEKFKKDEEEFKRLKGLEKYYNDKNDELDEALEAEKEYSVFKQEQSQFFAKMKELAERPCMKCVALSAIQAQSPASETPTVTAILNSPTIVSQPQQVQPTRSPQQNVQSHPQQQFVSNQMQTQQIRSPQMQPSHQQFVTNQVQSHYQRQQRPAQFTSSFQMQMQQVPASNGYTPIQGGMPPVNYQQQSVRMTQSTAQGYPPQGNFGPQQNQQFYNNQNGQWNPRQQ